jgi:hypothetical protein
VSRLLAYVTGLVNQELLLKNEYLLAENRILKTHLQPGFRLSRPEQTTLAEIGKRLGRDCCSKLPALPTLTPFSAGIANWWLRSSMAPDSVGCPAGRRRGNQPRPGRSSFGATWPFWWNQLL